MSKCAFAMEKVEYFGHFISGKGVETDPKKVQAVVEWPTPKSVKKLRSFLGLNYAVISRPLTNLLKKGAFSWSTAAQEAFVALKIALTTASVLAVPDFSHPFTVETDASNEGIGAVLMQSGHPLAYISRTLGPKWMKLSVYERNS
ncbi:putative mitochondrial protein AtMg00860 [Silene latifolia]|uniref:putative mitochondrial protein AtMg00860 n=1 Tax=Silene latifolia TaxID=37657 RepID=UPI003D786B58